jgi:hypothetical protein
MRAHLLVAALLLALAMPAAAERTSAIRLQVGQTAMLGGDSGACEDATIAAVSKAPPVAVTGVGPGMTICTFQSRARQRIYRVEVVAAAPAAPAAPATPGGKPHPGH